MSNIHEKTLARLSVAALAVDSMVVTLLIVGIHDAIKNYNALTPEWILLAIIPIVLGIHFLVVDLFAGGLSIGRLSTGLMLRDQKTGGKPHFTSAIKRCVSVLVSLGFPSLNPKTLPNYNKRQERCLCSDWVGSIPYDNQTLQRPPTHSARPVKEDAQKLGLKVIAGPNNGISKRFIQGRSFAKNNMFIVGRDAKSSDIILSDDKSVSSVQFRIALRNGKLFIIDGRSSSDASMHGTVLNGNKISNSKPSMLKTGDEIKVGQSRLKVV